MVVIRSAVIVDGCKKERKKVFWYIFFMIMRMIIMFMIKNKKQHKKNRMTKKIFNNTARIRKPYRITLSGVDLPGMKPSVRIG